MKRIIAYISCLAVMLASVGTLFANAAPAGSGKQLYADFTAELTADTPAASGNGENTITLYSGYTVTDFVQSDGELSMTFNNGNYVRFANTLPLGELDPNYMVVRMKGSNSWGDGLTGNALTFWFGSWGQYGADLNMTVEQLTADYSDMVIEIPEGYFDGLSSYDLFIESNRGAEFYVTIDEIYFCDTYPPESSEPEEPEADKYLYTDFTAELAADTPVLSGNGENTITLYSGYTVTDFVQSGGELSMTFNNGNYVRFANTLSLGELDPDYMVVRMKGSNSWGEGLTGDVLTFWFGSWGQQGTKLSMTSEQLTADYSDVVIEIPDGYFDGLTSYDLFIESNRGAEFYVTIDEIYFLKDGQTEEPETDSALYADFSEPLIEGTAVPSGADNGTITLFNFEGCTQETVDGALHISFTDELGYIRFTNTLVLTDDCKTGNYKYMILKIKGSFSDGVVPNGTALNFIIGNWGNEANPIALKADAFNADDYTTVALPLSDSNFAATAEDYKTGLIIRSAGNYKMDIYIDEIVFSNEEPDIGGSEPENPDPEEPEEPEVPEEPEDPVTKTKYIYSDFSAALAEGVPVSNGDGGTITLFAIEGGTQTVSSGALNLNLSGEGTYIRFSSSLELTDSSLKPKYKYMVIRIRGSAARSDGSAVSSGNLLDVIFGSWGNEGSALSISASQVSAADYTDILLELSDEQFVSTHPDYYSGIILKNGGNFNTDVQIDEIYFTNEKPADITDGEIGNLSENVQEKEKNYYSDFSAALEEGVVVSNGDGGTITLFNMEGAEQSVQNGALNLTLTGEGSYIRFNSSLQLTEDGRTAKYHYMVVRLSGSALLAGNSAASGNVVKFIMGSWGNEGSPIYLNASQLSDGYISSGDTENITVCGRGYFDGSIYPRYQEDGVTGNQKVPIDLANCTNVTISGIACLDPSGWAYNLYKCNDVKIDNVKIITSRQNGDGISVQSCDNVTVTNSFARTWDDSLVVKAYEGNTTNIFFSNCIIWSDLAQCCEVGYETRGDIMDNIWFRDITVLHANHKAVVSLHCGDHATVSNVHYENIVVEDMNSQGDGSNFLIDLLVEDSIWSKEAERGEIDGVYIKNVKIIGGTFAASRIRGYSSANKVKNVYIEDVEILGTKITDFQTGVFVTNPYIENINFN